MAEQSYGDWIRSNPELPTKEFKKEHMAQSAVEWLIEELIKQDRRSNPNSCTIQIYFEASKNIVDHALEMNKQQHGATWDTAIKAHDDRGHVHARSLVDFDEYFEETFKK
jgi:hypothetical protein